MFLLKDRCHLNMVLILHQMSKHLATVDLKPQAETVAEILKHLEATVVMAETAVLKVLHHKALVLMVAEMAGKALLKATEARMTAEVKAVLVLVNQLKHLRQNLKKNT